MGTKCYSKLRYVVVLVLLLFVFPCSLSQSAPSSVTGRRLMGIYMPNGGIIAGSSPSGQAPNINNNYHGRRLMISEARPSKSKKGGGREPESPG
ncbi:transmembrane protein [Arabidopsis thaliana]|uniref:Serine rich endogenous peptide 6 n=2 Tax=Arabidopsis thaliana TaxID=3702 RepID=SCOP6_ARATH|nr:uncharacterized protein AT5G44572 [Arabidopsis thaliana]Q0WML3.1 RecName: Full=Serine rich endogenous peptide 6; Short=AtSCOOP6; AltName: Full=Phytocytokine SCOOP6; AltName: Full=Precursor of serine rich endogenous peptide phytocytokine 6; Flags: Precursor [Arabidopsis thaliana]AED95129.1 transmembrane protein [Arabidopsis thaliana]BAF01637.1 hypothetical protein [Arabidopsis thaliana]|eukprot:NP_001078711.1 transmembrane protein [Arabidopsis thaliana]